MQTVNGNVMFRKVNLFTYWNNACVINADPLR